MAGVVAQLVAGARDDAQLGAAVGVAEHPGVERRDRLVVGPVHDEQRAGPPAPRRAVDGGWRGTRGSRRPATAGSRVR